MSSHDLCVNGTGARVQGRKAGEWVYIGEGAVLHVVAPRRAKREPEAVLAQWHSVISL